MVDYCAGDISTAEATELIHFLAEHLPEGVRLYPGVSYRHCLVWKNPAEDIGELTPPHDISGQKITGRLPDPAKAGVLLELMEKSFDLLKNHPVNQKRVAEGKRPANSMWFWGQGRKAALRPFKELYGLNASVISAVDLIKGIGILAKMEVLDVPGATGYIDTNFDGKAQAAMDAFARGQDLVYVHVEAPDECGHRGETANKVRAIELIDGKILGPVRKALEAQGDYRIPVLPDHPTPLAIRTHSSEPVPYLIYDSREKHPGVASFTESTARAAGNYEPDASVLMKSLIK